MDITLKQMQCLTAVAETKNFRRAAEKCGISQPSLSVQIKNLEHILRLQLVERGRAGVNLTPDGREVVRRARLVLDEVQGVVDYAEGAKGGLAGIIRLGSKPTLGPYLLPHVVEALHRDYKDLSLYVRESSPHELEFELTSGLHDLVLSQIPAISAELVSVPLFREPLYLALALDHPLASHEKINASSLKGLDILTLSANYHLHDQIYGLCDGFGARILRDYEGTSLDALRQMVGMGMGATFLPALYVHSEIGAKSEITVKKLEGRAITRSVGLLWRKSAGRAESYQQIGDIIRAVVKRKFKDLIIM